MRVSTVITLAAAAFAYPAYRWLAPHETAGGEFDEPEVAGRMIRAGPSVVRPLVPLGGFEQVAPIGTELPLEVRATDALGSPLSDTVVVFSVESGGATLAAGEARTDARGVATVPLRLPAAPAKAVVVAEVPGGSSPPIRIHIDATAGPPSRVRLVQGDRQSGSVGQLLARPIGVRVTDAAGNPVRGAEVRFDVLSGNGRVAPSRIRTDTAGLATARWRLGDAPGEQRLAAIVPAASDAVATFSADATGTADASASTADVPRPTSQVPVPAPSVADPSAGAPPEGGTTAPVSVARQPYAVGGSTVCGLVGGGRVSCRGGNDRGQRVSGAGGGFVFLSAGVSHACALDASGVASCWGANESGQLGDGSISDRATPTPVSTELRFSVLTTGVGHTCGLAASGRALCWGLNVNGQVGDGTRDDRRVPRRVAGDPSFRSIVAGWSHTCALDQSGTALCWGLNSDGQLGEGSRLDRLVPTRVGTGYVALAAGSAHTCAIRGTQVVCWGDNRFGQLGDGSAEDRIRPVMVRGLPGPAVRIVAGAVHTCALVEGGGAWCWGQNLSGQVGDGTTENRFRATEVQGGLSFTSLHAGGAMTCGFATDGREYCWGLNQSGQLGDRSRVNRAVPTPVGG